ncbi:GDSL esterase/lipase CPRD49 [Striga asiatica]|uniref:GDSL esterase/lipase CPRD49 n=1 Tax=Striga asiatica TaxID=4170 RepID=A0A5A7RDJ0_STRAF|nr:GDSL esterase/lipase CPRD49 [Striga asiatica]
MVGPGRPQFVLFGSSIVQMSYNVGGWGSIFADLYTRKADVVLRGYSGWNTRMALEILEIVFPKSLSDETRIICLTSPPVNEAKVREIFGNGLDDQARTNESCRIYSEALVDLCMEMDVEAINLWTAIQERDDWANACFIDGIHLSAEGSKIVVKEILKVLKKIDWEPSLYWLKMTAEFSEDSPYYVVNSNGSTTVNVSSHISTWQREWLDI